MVAGLTDFAGTVALRKRIYSARVLGPARDDSFFLGDRGLLGKGMGDDTKPIYYVNELTKTTKGDSCIMPFVMELEGDGVPGDNKIGTNVEALTPDYAVINIDRTRMCTQSIGQFSEQRTMIMFKAQARDKVGYNYGRVVDEMLFQAASGVAYTLKTDGSARNSQMSQYRFAADITAPSSNRKVFAGTATSTGTLTSSDKMSWNLLVKAKAKAVQQRLKPLRFKGQQTYIVVMDPFQARDLRLDPDYRAAVAGAGIRGEKNELFTGMFANVDGLVLYEHNRVCNNRGGTLWGAGTTVEGAQALLLGAQALAYAQIGELEEIEPDTDDWGNQQGHGVSTMLGILKPQFKAQYITGHPTEDFSVLNIYTAAAA